MRAQWAGLGAALVFGSFSACDCGTTTPGQGDGGNGTADGSAIVDGSGGFDLVGRDLVGYDLVGHDLATGTDRPGWQPVDGSITLLEGGVIITEDGGAQWQCVPMACLGNGPLACADCTDNDGDSRIDWRDPECLGPCDNTEGPGLDSDVGGTSGTQCGVDCYFDFGNGAGWDDCQWDHRCDPLSPEGLSEPRCAYDPGFIVDHGDRECPADQSQTCYDKCKPITPNGCDCFGCCTFPALATAGADGGAAFVWIGNLTTTDAGSNTSVCTLAKLTDPVACPRCTPVGNCYNECGYCELCVGKPTLPEDCYRVDAGVPDAWAPQIDAAGRDVVGIDLTAPRDAARPDVPQPDAWVPPRCENNLVPCGLAGDPECTPPFYCVTGCCVYFGG